MTKRKLYPVIWDTKAFDDLKEILSYLTKRSEQAPKLIKQGIKKSIDIIKVNPFVFELDELKTNNDESYRAFIVYSYRISYRFIENKILILRIRPTSRNPLEH